MSELPDGWAKVALPYVAAVLDTRRIPLNADERNQRIAGKAADSLVPYYGATGQVGWIDEALFDENLVLLGEDGAPFLDPQKPKAYRIAGKSWVNNHAHVLRAREGVLDWRLLERQLNSIDYTGFVTGTTRLKLTQGAMNTLPILVPPFQEQTRIANQLDTLLARVQACNNRFDAIPTLLKRFRQTVLDAATFGTLTESWRESNGGDYEWKEVQLRDIADVQGGVTKDSKKQSILDEEVPYLRVANVQRGYIDLTVVKTIRVPNSKLEGLLLAEGDVLFNEGGDLDKLGRGWVWAGQITRCTFQNHVFRARLFDKSNQPKFLSWWGNSRGLEYFLRSGKQTTNLASINKTMLAALPIRLPSAAEQTEIVRRVEALFALADRIEARCATARAQAQRLSPLVLAKAFRGELVQQDPQDEPASVLLQRIAAQPAKVQTSRGRRRSQRETHPPHVPVLQPDWTVLPDGAWAAPADPDGHAAVALLAAVLKAWGRPMPQMQTRLATLLCQQPRLFTAVLPADQAAQWRRLVGSAANPLPAQVTSFQPATNSHWRRALVGMRARGDLIESGIGPQETWALGPGAAHIETAGWPEGRAEWVAAYLRAHGVEAILPLLEPAAQEFVNVKAA